MCIWAEFSQLQPADVGVVVYLDFSRHLQSDHPWDLSDKKTKWLWQNVDTREIIREALIEIIDMEWTLKKSAFSFFCIYLLPFSLEGYR